MIAVTGLSFRFEGSSGFALRDVNLTVAPGEFLVVTGPSGCGKSTLALAVGGYLSRRGAYAGEVSGAVTVAGIDACQRPIYEVAEVVGLVQQNPEAQFCTLTVQDEVAFGLENRCLPRNEIRERISWALRIVGAQHLIDRSLSTLSGGEKQKVAIAAMMATRPQVLIFDEPTSNLDPTATAEVFRVIAGIRADSAITVIVIEHKIGYLLSFSPRLVAMDAGRVVYDGPASPWLGAWDGLRRPTRPASQHAPLPRTSRAAPVVRVVDLHVGYDGDAVLQGVSLEIAAGQFVAVMGDNGSGKTTFLHSLLGFLQPSQGRVEVLGQDTRRVPVSQLSRQVGFVFQNPDHQLFADSVWDEAIFAARNFGLLDDKTEAKVADLLEHCGLGRRREDHPYRLSYGEKRRLNLISVLAYAPCLILLDEILTGQDAGNAAFLLDLLFERVAQGDTVIMVNHAPEISYCYASRLLFFADGQVLVDAPTDSAFQQLAAQGRAAYLPSAGVGR